MMAPPTISGTAPRTPRASRVEWPRATSTCEIQPVNSTTAAPNIQGSIEMAPASLYEKPSPFTMNGVNQVRPSESAQ